MPYFRLMCRVMYLAGGVALAVVNFRWSFFTPARPGTLVTRLIILGHVHRRRDCRVLGIITTKVHPVYLVPRYIV